MHDCIKDLDMEILPAKKCPAYQRAYDQGYGFYYPGDDFIDG